MPDTFIHVKGILNDSCRDDVEPNFVSHKFVIRHDDEEDFGKKFNMSMAEIFSMQGLLVNKGEPAKPGLENLMFVPMHRIARLEFERKKVVGQYPQGGEGTRQ